jgi:hypothetical protein
MLLVKVYLRQASLVDASSTSRRSGLGYRPTLVRQVVAPGANLTHRLEVMASGAYELHRCREWFARAQNAPQATLSQHTRRFCYFQLLVYKSDTKEEE